MNKKIGNVLVGILPTFFITKGISKEKEYIIFNYLSSPAYYSDNTIKGTNYTILINLYCYKNIEEYKEKIINAMRDSGFIGGNIEATNMEADKDGKIIYNTAIKFKGYKENI